jgi:hypothetical protein
MGLFDIFKKKTTAERNIIKLRKLRSKTIVHETESMMQDMIFLSPHDDSFLDENPSGEGPFGLVKTNPVPVHGIDNIPAYMDKLRYKFSAKSGSDIVTYNHLDFQRTTDLDNSEIGSRKPPSNPVASSTSSPNIKGHIDVYNLYTIGGKKKAKIYINSYSLITSNKVPKGFIHRDDTPAEKDTKALVELMKHIT